MDNAAAAAAAATRRISLEGAGGGGSSEDKENGNVRKRSTAMENGRNARFTNAKALFEKLGSAEELDRDQSCCDHEKCDL